MKSFELFCIETFGTLQSIDNNAKTKIATLAMNREKLRNRIDKNEELCYFMHSLEKFASVAQEICNFREKPWNRKNGLYGINRSEMNREVQKTYPRCSELHSSQISQIK
ncbi:hypothetical protein T01_8315, partial [Trichinella spiralis]